MEEIFKDIKDYEGLYQVSDHGRVRSLNYNHTEETRVLKHQLDKDGYECLKLSKNGKHKTCKVHRLVAEAFIPNPDGLPQVNHIDEDKTNNCVWNLEWCDCNYNINYGTGVERRSRRVYQYTKSGSFIRSYASTREAERQTGIANPHISACCNGKRKSTYGYRWSFNPPTPSTNRVLW